MVIRVKPFGAVYSKEQPVSEKDDALSKYGIAH